MKIVTYNVNGLRPRIAQHGSLLKLLNSLEADIICFQETKLSREEVTADVIMAEGYESFFSCTCTSGRGRLGYSGVATFCRVNSAFSSSEVALPTAAEEGFTGLLEHCCKANSMKKELLLDIPTKVDGIAGFSNLDLLNIDSEGRCIITDHGHFVLFNIYGPCVDPDDTERVDFKLAFYKILQKRWESYFKQGRRILVVGDLNIAPSAIDRCEAGPDFEKNQFRKWFRSLLVDSGGAFSDAFRVKHPQRKDAYTCWSVASGAEQFNFGSRIDHILVAGSCLHHNDNMDGHNFVDCHVIDCDIMSQFKRWKPDNAPRSKGGRNIKLEGSDHAPVYVSLRGLPDIPVHSTPSLAARYVPKIHGLQQTIVTFLSKRQSKAQVEDQESSQVNDENTYRSSCGDNAGETLQDCCVSDSPLVQNPCATSCSASNEDATADILVMSRSVIKNSPVGNKKSNKKARHDNSNQRTLGSYFQKKSTVNVNIDCTNASLSQEPSASEGLGVSNGTGSYFQEKEVNILPSIEESPEKEKKNAASVEWQRIQQLMLKRQSVPLCKGHREPCVLRVVKKEGPNFGRKFYVCQRAQGPSTNPEARCDYFKWEAPR